MQKKHQGVSSANCCWWLRQQELASSPPSLLPFSCRWPSTRTRHWRETWCKALWLVERPMPSSTWSWAWLPPTLFFVSEILYKVIPFENTHCAAPRLLWRTYDSFNGLTAKWCPKYLWLLRSAHKMNSRLQSLSHLWWESLESRASQPSRTNPKTGLDQKGFVWLKEPPWLKLGL